MNTIKGIDLTPTLAEYTNMARLFARAVVDDARAERQHDTGKLLGSLVEVIAYLARVQPDGDDVLALVNTIKREADRPAPRHARATDPCRCIELPWAKGPCPNLATGPDGWCDECRAAVAEGDGAQDGR